MVDGLNTGVLNMGFQFYRTDTSAECPECNGEGTSYVEVWVDTYPNGGFLEERLGHCINCDGTGYVQAHEEDYDDE